MIDLEDILTISEMRMLEAVWRSPGCKRPGELDSYPFEKLQKLGLIESVGSYKWIPTDKVKVKFFGEDTEAKCTSDNDDAHAYQDEEYEFGSTDDCPGWEAKEDK